MDPEILPKTKKENYFKEFFKIAIIAIVIVIPFRMFIAEPFMVNGESMDPTFDSGHYLIVDRITYRFKAPERLDIIVFDYPKEAVKYTENTNIYLIKRIIGLPGETLNIKDGKVTVINKEHPEGIIIPDNFVIDSHRTNENLDITLGPTEYYVMGDNRANSLDSRKWGPLEEKYIVGRPILRLLPFSKIGILPGK